MTDKTGFAAAADVADDYAMLSFVVHQITGGMATGGPVKVLSVAAVGDVAPVGYLDMQPLTHQMDGAGNAVPHGPLYNVPYFRLQGGVNAVIIDPVAGDIGLAVYASSDASRVKNTRGPALPASRRRFDMADGFYLGGFLNGAPENFIRFTSSGDIELKPASKVTVLGDLDVSGSATVGDTFAVTGASTLGGTLSVAEATTMAGTITVDGAATFPAGIDVTGDVVANTISLTHHTHPVSGSATGAPNP